MHTLAKEAVTEPEKLGKAPTVTPAFWLGEKRGEREPILSDNPERREL